MPASRRRPRRTLRFGRPLFPLRRRLVSHRQSTGASAPANSTCTILSQPLLCCKLSARKGGRGRTGARTGDRRTVPAAARGIHRCQERPRGAAARGWRSAFGRPRKAVAEAVALGVDHRPARRPRSGGPRGSPDAGERAPRRPAPRAGRWRRHEAASQGGRTTSPDRPAPRRRAPGSAGGGASRFALAARPGRTHAAGHRDRPGPRGARSWRDAGPGGPAAVGLRRPIPRRVGEHKRSAPRLPRPRPRGPD